MSEDEKLNLDKNTFATNIISIDDGQSNIKSHYDRSGISSKETSPADGRYNAYPVLVLDKPTKDGQIFTHAVVERALSRMHNGRRYGEEKLPPGNPTTHGEFVRFSTVEEDSVSHVVHELASLHEKVVYVYARPLGKKAQVFEMLEEQGVVKLAMRAMGKVDENNVVTDLQILGFDLVR